MRNEWRSAPPPGTRRVRGVLAFWLAAACLAGGVARAQTSPSYKLVEHAINAGGDPTQGVALTSASFEVTLDAVGEGVLGAGIGSASFRMDGGFVAAHPPPGEVENLRWAGKTSIAWDPEKSAGTYRVYRDTLSSLPGGYGACLATGLTSPALVDPGSPAAGAGWFYLVTSRSGLGEEGTKGNASDDTERPNPAPCP
jgi:hypothetical protein